MPFASFRLADQGFFLILYIFIFYSLSMHVVKAGQSECSHLFKTLGCSDLRFTIGPYSFKVIHIEH
jgi:hypothetical protein